MLALKSIKMIRTKRRNRIKRLKKERIENLFSELDLSGLDGWEPKSKEKAKDLITAFSHIFTLGDLEQGKTSVAKQHITLTHYKCHSKKCIGGYLLANLKR